MAWLLVMALAVVALTVYACLIIAGISDDEADR